MNSLLEDIQDTTYKYKHQIEFSKVMGELSCHVWLAECDSGSDCDWSACDWSDVSYDTDSDSDYHVTTR